MTDQRIQDEVREYYRAAAGRRSEPIPVDPRWGVSLYEASTLTGVDETAVNLSMGCGNPYLLADLEPGEVVLDLGSGGGLDVILSARRVGPTGRAIGLDYLEEMVEVARANAAETGVDNVEFLRGSIDDIPLPAASVDVVISNCVINLAADKRAVFAEVFRVLRSGGRVAVSDVVAENGYRPPEDGDAWADCGAGALEHDDYLAVLAECGFDPTRIEYTHETGPGLHAASIRARRP